MPGSPLRIGPAVVAYAARSGSAAVPLRCLIVDDSRRFLRAARTLLGGGGLAVVGVALTGTEALRRVEELKPDVMLVDIDLAGESGFELARRVRGETGPVSPRVVLISIHAEEDYAELIATSPVAGFLRKTALSARAIHALLSKRRRGANEVSGHPRT